MALPLRHVSRCSARRSIPTSKASSRLNILPSSSAQKFHTSTRLAIPNRVFTSVRNEDEFSSLLLLSSANHTPLLTFWTASWCPSCRVVAPLVREMVERDGVGEKEGGVAFAEVELDSVTIGDLGMRYMITSIPTLLSFSRQEAQLATKVTSVEDMKNPKFLKEWIENEAKRGGTGGAGGGLFGIFGR